MTTKITYQVAYFDANNQLLTIENFRNGFPTDANLTNALHSICVREKKPWKGATAILTKQETITKTISI